MKIIKLEDNEINALMELMDAGIKTLGYNRVIGTAILIQKIENAPEVKEEPAPKKPESKPKPKIKGVK